MAKISNPFPGNPPVPPAIPGVPPRFTPGATSPLDRTARDAASRRVSLDLAQEQRRAEALPGQIVAGRATPRYGDVPAPAPYPASGDRATRPQPSVPPQRIRADGAGGSPEGAGGSK